MKAYWLLKNYSMPHGLREFDSLIAATALAYDLTLVTRNEKHYRFIPDLRLQMPGY